MTTNTFNPEELELLAAGYVLDDLDEAEKAQVEELIRTNPAMVEQIRQSIAVMEILAADVPPSSTSLNLKNKIIQAFVKEKNELKTISESENLAVKSLRKTTINLSNWFLDEFEAGWQKAAGLLSTPTLTPAFRHSGISGEKTIGQKTITIGPDRTTIILILTVTQTSLSDRDVTIEVKPSSEPEFLPQELQIQILDGEGNPAMEATTSENNKNIKFEFSGIVGETFSLKVICGDDSVSENYDL